MPNPSRREGKSISEKMEERHTGRIESAGLMNTIDRSLEDMRSIITCRVCVRPLYEPFTVECGHTFCYTCLMSWFEKNAANKSCPDCRAKITKKPAPAYLIREMTQLFSNRAELLPAGETTQEHQDQQREEAQVLEQDRRGRGLFRGCFRHDGRRAVGFENRIIIDDEDGVNRCPRCTWEVEDGECAGCGWPGEAESWDDDSVVSFLMHSGLGNDERLDPSDTDPNNTDPSSDQDASNESGDMDDSEDESIGSLNEFVVQDERSHGERHRSRLTRRNLEWRFPRRESRSRESAESTDASADTLSGRTPDPRHQNEIDVDSPDSSSTPSSFMGEELHTDELSQLSRSPGSRYVDDAGNVQYRRSSNAVPGSPAVAHFSDDEDIAPFTRARNDRRLRLLGLDQGIQSPPPHVLDVSSDSDEPIAPSLARRRRNIQDLNPNTNSNARLTRNDALRSRAAHLRFAMSSDGDDGDVDDGDTRQRVPQGQVIENEPSLIEIGDSEDALVSQTQRVERNSRSRLDPTTSIPIRRENVNMPGAFPPSFVSEQGQSQSTPLVNFQDLTSSSPRGSSLTRQARQSQDHDSTFLDRRRHEERTYAAQGDQLHRRDRSAAKSARRQDRQRVKATQEARGRRNGEPSVPPSTTS